MSIKLGLHTGPQNIGMEELVKLWQRGEAGGLHWISVWDHFYGISAPDSKDPCFEAVSAMAALAMATTRVRVGCLVFCTMYRSPGMLAKAAVTIDHLSNGRAELGMGGGWFQQEFDDFGYDFPPIGERLSRLEEGLQVVASLFRDDVTNFEGKYFQYRDAVCTPKPVQQRMRIWVGGGGPQRTPSIAARHGDGYNSVFMAPEAYRERIRVLDAACEKIGRDPASVERSINLGFSMGADEAAADKKKQIVAGLPEAQRPGFLVGTAPEVIDRIGEYQEAGAQGVNVSVRPPVDWDAFEAFLENVVPRFHQAS